MADLYNTPSAPPPAAAGLSDNVAGGLAYITIIPAIIFLVLEPYNRREFVRFQCFQSLLIFAVQVVIGIVRATLTAIMGHVGYLLGSLLSFAVFICLVIACVQAFQGRRLVLPGIGPLALQLAGRA